MLSDPADARRRLDEVYSRPPLDGLDRPRPHNLIDDIASAFGRLINTLFSHLGTGGSTLLGLIAVALVVALAVYLLRRVSAGRLARATIEPAQSGIDHDAEWAAALAAAAAGDHREAVRRAFRSALLAVAARGRMTVDPAWTTRELLARIEGDADLLAALAPAAAAFDIAWYSGRPVTQADWQRQRRLCETIRGLARRGRTAVT
jgi:hypothetical protein